MTSARAIPTITTPDALIASFERAGYARVAPAILQPAEPFLDLSGEDIRKRMYLTTDPQGRELCLRPNLTLPVSRDYLASPAAGKPRGFCYLGPVFRHRAEGGGEFLQAGIESFGRGLDYYTGFVFELHDPLARTLGPLVAGGRYDGLLTRLGSASAIAAVGFAVWIERLAALRSAS